MTRKQLRHATIRMLRKTQKREKTIRIIHRMAWLIEERGYKVKETYRYFPLAKCYNTIRLHYRLYEMKKGFAEKGQTEVTNRQNYVAIRSGGSNAV